VLHSAALRRLAAKTQVVVAGEDDFPRTRLTHSLECAQIGRELAASLAADPEVVEAACLAHDLGHPPFGHNGEQALDAAAGACGGFEGNAQSLRVLTRLEAKVAGPDGASAGLNLTRATLDAAVKYPWPRSAAPAGQPAKYGVYAQDAGVFAWLREGAPVGRRCFEAQLMDWADDVAYSVHDLEDGIHGGHVPIDAVAAPPDGLVELAIAQYWAGDAAAIAQARQRLGQLSFWPAGHDGSFAAQVALKRMTSELIGRFCGAAVRATVAAAPEPRARYGADLVVPEAVRAECALLKAVTAHFVMARASQRPAQARQREWIAELVAVLTDRAPGGMEPGLRAAYGAAPDDAARLRVVVDQVASLTDISARAWHARLSEARA
jgi:dGTPase